MALKRVPLELVQGWPELDGALMELELDAADLIGSFGGWIRARGLSCHCLVDSCPGIFKNIVDPFDSQIFTYQCVLWSFRNLWRFRQRWLVEVGGWRSGNVEKMKTKNKLEVNSGDDEGSPWGRFIWQRKGFYQVLII